MLRKQTNREFDVKSDRGIIKAVIHMIIDKMELDRNNIIAIGYYYYYNQDGSVYVLDPIRTLKLWDKVSEAEEYILNPFESNRFLKKAVLQRLNEFTTLQFILESGENYGTMPDDWIDEVEPQPEQPIQE